MKNYSKFANLNGWQLLALIWRANSVHGARGLLGRLAQRAIYVLRLIPYIRQIRDFLQVNDGGFLQQELWYSLVPLRSISRPYVHAGWSVPERIYAVQNHYDILTQENFIKFQFSPEQYWDCVRKEFDSGTLVIKIDKVNWMRPEGELVLSIFWGIHRAYALAFSLQSSATGRVFRVGALQGWQNEAAKDLYAELTTCMHGLRPRDLMVNLAKILANSLDCETVWGISDDCHHTNIRGNADKKHSAYDGIWRENGGILNEQGFFVLPAAVRKKALTDIASKKRAQYRRRYELLDELQIQMTAAFESDSVEFSRH